MSVAIDANLLVYASDESSEHHERAATALAKLAGGDDLVYLFWPVTMAYLRIATHPAVFERPLTPELAIGNIDNLMRRDNVRTPGEEHGFWEAFARVTGGLPVRGNLVPDAHVVTLMRQYGVNAIVSHDRDFRKFDGVKVIDPLA